MAKLKKTSADYLAIAVGPLLIMLLVGSLVFFLLEIGYTGEHLGRMRWVLFWFVMATVLVGRIGIEQGKEHAAAYGLALAAATCVFIFRFIEMPIVPILLLGAVWWCVNKLTWDCTLIDDREDASGQGLLQVAGLDTEDEPDSAVEDEKTSGQRTPWWQQFFGNQSERRGKAHAPGLWIVYFSLAALPLFGIGQSLFEAGDTEARDFGFRLLFVYVAAALGLLLCTSFLGLRRYLRQRRLQMPASMTAAWIVTGSLLAVGILALCILLPRPNAAYSLTAMLDRLESKTQQANRFAMLDDDSGKGEGRRIGKPGEKDEKQDGKKDADDGKGEGKGKDKAGGKGKGDGKNKQDGQDNNDHKAGGQGKSKDKSGSGEGDAKGAGKGKSKGGKKGDGKGAKGKKAEKGGEAKNGKQKQKEKQKEKEKEKRPENAKNPGEQQQPDAQPESSADHQWLANLLKWTAKLFKWIIYALLIVGGAILLYKYWQPLLQALVQMWLSLLGLFNRTGGDKKRADGAEETPQRPRPFADFDNPFLAGRALQIPPAELVRYTFEALQAWACEQGLERGSDQTPLEFSQALTQRHESMSKEIRQVTQLYTRLAYAGRQPSQDCLEVLEQLWRKMTDDVRAMVAS